MKLIRLTQSPSGTNDSDLCIFNSTINEDMIITPDSQIALQNISFEVLQLPLVITATNNRIVISINGTYTATVELTENEYKVEQFETFIFDFLLTLNAGLTFTATVLGTEFDVYLNNANFLRINLQRGDIGTSNLELKNISENAGVYSRSIIGTGNDAFLFGRTPMARGAGYFRARIPNVPIHNGMILGLTNVAKSSSTATIGIADIKYGIRVNSSHYFTIVDGVETQVAGPVAPSNNDIIEVHVDLGDIVIGYYTALDTIINELVNVADYRTLADTKNLYPCLVIEGSAADNNQVDEVVFAASPYDDGDGIYSSSTSLLAAPQPYTGEYNWSLTFETLEIAQNFGFPNQTTPTINNTIDDGILRAPKKFDQNNHHDHFVIQIDNLKLKTYDDEIAGRLNILAVTSESDENLIFRFRPPYPLFLDIDNNQTQTMRNIKMKVLDENLDIITTVGKSQATLLFKDKNEN